MQSTRLLDAALHQPLDALLGLWGDYGAHLGPRLPPSRHLQAGRQTRGRWLLLLLLSMQSLLAI